MPNLPLSLSSDGSTVAFTSSATNLFPSPGIRSRYYVKDLTDGSIIDGAGPGVAHDLSGDGDRVAFVSNQPLVPEDTLRVWDVYVRDLETSELFFASANLPKRQVV